MHFTHLSLKNKYHLYSIENDKIVRDDYLMDFMHPDLIKCYYRNLPNLTEPEIRCLICELRSLNEYKDMVIALYCMIDSSCKVSRIKRLRSGEKTEKVKELLKFIKRDFNFVV